MSEDRRDDGGARLRGEGLALGYDERTVSTDLTVEIPDGSFTVIVGPNACGKSTLLKGLLNKDEEPKATLALEYSYCSKTKQGRKEIAHIWEIGGGTAMQNLLDVPLTESSVRTATVM